MSGLNLNKEISLPQIIQICLLLLGMVGGYFALVSSVSANTGAHEENAIAIAVIEEETDGLDLLNYKVDLNAQSLARIERKLDEN